MRNIIVAGGRDFDDWRSLDGTLVQIVHSDDTIIQGGAKGADFLAKVWAKYYGVNCVEYPADWNTHRRAAGGIRNQQMIDDGRADTLVAFPGGHGTSDMIQRAVRCGLTLYAIERII